MSITVRQAVVADALAATHILRRSISQLCVADHRNDPVRHLNGTTTARRFYEDRAYIPAGQTNEVFKSMACQSMVKRFAP